MICESISKFCRYSTVSSTSNVHTAGESRFIIYLHSNIMFVAGYKNVQSFLRTNTVDVIDIRRTSSQCSEYTKASSVLGVLRRQRCADTEGFQDGHRRKLSFVCGPIEVVQFLNCV